MRQDPTFDQFFTGIYLPRARARKRSWTLDERLARRHISPALGSRRLRQITRLDVENWLSGLRAGGLAPSTCNRILAVLRSAFALAEALAFIGRDKSPCRGVSNFRVVNTKERFLDQAQGQRLIAHLTVINRQEARIVQLLLLTGARKSEIIRARWENLDCERRILTVPVSKSGRPRYIYLPEEAVKIFESVNQRGASPWIFPGRNPEKPISDIYRFWKGVRNELGLENIRIHDLRHTFASYVVASGHTLYVAQQLLGHSDPRTTMRYAHFAQKTLLAAVGVLDRIIGNPKSKNRLQGVSTKSVRDNERKSRMKFPPVRKIVSRYVKDGLYIRTFVEYLKSTG